MSTFFTILGLGFDVIGAWCVACELLFRLPKRNRQYILVKQLENLRSFVALVTTGKLAPPSPPYNNNEISEETKKVLEEWQPRIDALEAEISKLGEGHEERSYMIGWFGIILLTLGFGSQILGALC